MTSERILLDPPGLRVLGRELQAAAETALEMRDRVCVEECSLLPSSSSALADEILQGARQTLHGLAGAYTMTARDLVSRADEVETCQARWWGAFADGNCGGVILPDGSYVQQGPLTEPGSTATSSAWGPGQIGQTAISAAWGQGLTGFEPTVGSYDPGQGLSSSVGYINLTGPYSPPSDPSDSVAYINLTSSFDPLPDTSSSVGYINLTGPYSPPSDSSDSVAYVNLPGIFDLPSDPTGSVGSVFLPIPGIGTVDPSGSVGSALAGLDQVIANNYRDLQNQVHNLGSGLLSPSTTNTFLPYMLQQQGQLSNALDRAMDPN